MIKYAAAAALAAVLGSKYTSQPPPYDDGAASLIKVDARLLAGNAHGAPFPPVYKGKWALNDRLTKATRLFEGQVEGSESVATLSDGTLLTVDKYGWVWTCVLNLRVVLHAIDATPARWRGDAGSSPLDPRNDLVKNYRVHPTHWLISTQFSTTPRIGTSNFRSMLTPLTTSATASSDGVVTTTQPL